MAFLPAFRFRKGKTILFTLFLGLLVSVAAADAARGELSAESFCSLHIEVMEKSVSKLEGEIIVAEYESALEKLYAGHKTTEEEYLLFMGGRGREVRDYLKAHPEVQKRMDNLAERLDSAADAEETLHDVDD